MSNSFSAGDWDVWILKLSSSGDVEWQRSYGSFDHEFAESIRQTGEGGYITAGYKEPYGAGLRDFLVQKLTPEGEVEWQKTYGEEWHDNAHSIQQTRDGGYVLAGEINKRIAVTKLAPTGAIEWKRVYWTPSPGYGSYDSFVRSIKQTNDGGYIITGDTYFGIKDTEILVLKLSPSGDIEWQRAYGGEREYDTGVDIDELADGGYIVAGRTWSFGAGNSDILILRLDARGEIEKFPELTEVPGVQSGDSSLTSQDMAHLWRETNAAPLAPDILPYLTEKETWLIFSPPYLAGERLLNRSLSQAEYIDLLSWVANPNNSDLNIVKYRLYLVDYSFYYGEQRLLAEIDTGPFTYMVRNVRASAVHTYAVCGVTDKGEEGMRDFAVIQRMWWYSR
ncbi:MAG: hypothetical protein AB1715_03595 [Acidobacteriota bacterium]